MIENQDDNQVLVFRVGPVVCCVDAHLVESIVHPQALHRFPRQADFISGVLQYQNRTVAIVSLFHKFELITPEHGTEGRYVMGHTEKGVCGFWVDEVLEITDEYEEQSEPPAYLEGDTFKNALLWRDRIILKTDFTQLFNMTDASVLRNWVQEQEDEELPVAKDSVQINPSESKAIEFIDNRDSDEKLQALMSLGVQFSEMGTFDQESLMESSLTIDEEQMTVSPLTQMTEFTEIDLPVENKIDVLGERTLLEIDLPVVEESYIDGHLDANLESQPIEVIKELPKGIDESQEAIGEAQKDIDDDHHILNALAEQYADSKNNQILVSNPQTKKLSETEPDTDISRQEESLSEDSAATILAEKYGDTQGKVLEKSEKPEARVDIKQTQPVVSKHYVTDKLENSTESLTNPSNVEPSSVTVLRIDPTESETSKAETFKAIDSIGVSDLDSTDIAFNPSISITSIASTVIDEAVGNFDETVIADDDARKFKTDVKAYFRDNIKSKIEAYDSAEAVETGKTVDTTETVDTSETVDTEFPEHSDIILSQDTTLFDSYTDEYVEEHEKLVVKDEALEKVVHRIQRKRNEDKGTSSGRLIVSVLATAIVVFSVQHYWLNSDMEPLSIPSLELLTESFDNTPPDNQTLERETLQFRSDPAISGAFMTKNVTSQEEKLESTLNPEIKAPSDKSQVAVSERFVETSSKAISNAVSDKNLESVFNWKTHRIIRGDTLWELSDRYLNDPFRYVDLATWNQIKNPDKIYPGNDLSYNTSKDAKALLAGPYKAVNVTKSVAKSVATNHKNK